MGQSRRPPVRAKRQVGRTRYLAHLQTHLRQRRRRRGAALLARQERMDREFSDCCSAIEDEVGFQSCIREKETTRELRQGVVM